MLTIIGDAPSRNGRRALYRCACSAEFVARRTDVDRGVIRSCGCQNKRFKSRRRSERVELMAVPRFVPASCWRTDAAVVGAILIALRLPFDELSFLSPIDAELLRDLAGLDEDDLDRVGLRRWLRADAHGRVFGIRASASDVFGAASVGERVESTDSQEAA